jgi:hypothetical protein
MRDTPRSAPGEIQACDAWVALNRERRLDRSIGALHDTPGSGDPYHPDIINHPASLYNYGMLG